MMRWTTFSRSIAFAALAAVVWIPWALFVVPVIGLASALVLYLSGLTTIYVAGITPPGASPLRTGMAVAVVVLLLASLTPTVTDLVLALALTVAVARSAFLHPRPAGRALAEETVLIGAGLVFARFLGGISVAEAALAIWGFLLVQSLFFLLPRRGRRSERHRDDFEEAHRNAVVLLERSRS